MSRISEINTEDFDPRIADSEFLFASDVQNPLVGSEGASSVFGPQKGTTPAMVEMLDKALTSWADLVEVKTGIHLHDKAGAAGGIGTGIEALYDHGITSVHSLVKAPIPLKEAMERGAGFLGFSAK